MFWMVLILFGILNAVLAKEFCEDSLIKNLPDNAITVSTNYTNEKDEKQFGAHKTKFTSITGSFPNVMAGAWVAETIDQNQWLQIDLKMPSIVTEIVTKGRNIDIWTGCCQQWVTSYFVQYSTDNITWSSANSSNSKTSLFSGNNNTDGSVNNKLDCPVITRYIKILPQSWHGHIALRVDVRGCKIQTDSSTIPTIDIPFPKLREVSETHDNRYGTNQDMHSGELTTAPPWKTIIPPEDVKPNSYPQSRSSRESTTPYSWYARDWDARLTESHPWKRNWRITAENLQRYLPQGRRSKIPNEFNPRSLDPRLPFQQGVIAPKTNDRCIESCYNRPDGDYQSCRSCIVYVSCSNGYTFDHRGCPGNLVWNDDQKICDWTSPTCA